jgi:single-strand DNA-binding protein
MASFNKVLLMGNLVRDPELRVTPSGLSVCRITVACSRTVRSEKAEGGSREETTFVDVESFGKQAESVAKFFNKGRPIFVEGRLRLNEWTNQAGEKRSKLVIVLENFTFIGSNPNYSRDGVSQHSDGAPGKSNFASETAEPLNSSDEDVPF